MTDSNVIQRALERLDSEQVLVDACEPEVWRNDLNKPLAALIRAAIKSHNHLTVCGICYGTNEVPFHGGSKILGEVAHATDCALIALCEAITGEKL